MFEAEEITLQNPRRGKDMVSLGSFWELGGDGVKCMCGKETCT